MNHYISVEQLPTDAKVAAVLCIGGAIKYCTKAGSHVTRMFLREVVCPGIDAYFPDESNHIIIAGNGRVGGIVRRMLSGAGHTSTVIDFSAKQLELLRVLQLLK